jgi:hypothetical protein
MYYSGRINTYKLDRTTVTVGAPRVLAMSTSPASAGASSYASVAAASSGAAVAGSVLPSATGAGTSSAPRALPWWGLGYDYPLQAPSPYPNHLRHPTQRGSEGGISCKQGNFVVSMQHRDISTRLPYSRWLNYWDVVFVTLNFLATCLRATLRGFLGGAGKLASRLVG